jgi:hypothetical protein
MMDIAVTDEKWRQTWAIFEDLRGRSKDDCAEILSNPTLDPEVVSELRALVESSSTVSFLSSVAPVSEGNAPVYQTAGNSAATSSLG